MATTLSAAMENGDEDYIDMEVSSSATFFCYSIGSPQQVSGDFEFQMPSTSLESETTLISPADELFYKGNLLPLQIPPRLQMVEKLLKTSTTSHENKAESFAENYTSSTTPTTTSSTPFDSYNVSPTHSYTVSKELNAADYFCECPTDKVIGFIDENPKKSWSKKLKLIKQSSLGMMLKSSGAYFKSLFSKSGCSDESCFETNRRNGVEGIASKGKECLNKYMKVGRTKNPFGQIQIERYKMTGNVMKGIGREKMSEANGYSHRKSFTGIIKQCPSSSLFSNANSKDFFELHLLRRSKSDNSAEIESAVQGAIAHCKQSPVAVLIRKDRK
ncbi:hypothetical protein MKX01_027925 [Papaver californicum]|nr:hypothetical protein MKX01_027925 [Papaver californicum]